MFLLDSAPHPLPVGELLRAAVSSLSLQHRGLPSDSVGDSQQA